MYLRRNSVRCGNGKRVYLSIAHNVWNRAIHVPQDDGRPPQSRPVILLRLGTVEDVCQEVAREILSVLDEYVSTRWRKSPAGEWLDSLVAELRSVTDQLRRLATIDLRFASEVPDREERRRIIRSLVLASCNIAAQEGAAKHRMAAYGEADGRPRHFEK